MPSRADHTNVQNVTNKWYSIYVIYIFSILLDHVKSIRAIKLRNKHYIYIYIYTKRSIHMDICKINHIYCAEGMVQVVQSGRQSQRVRERERKWEQINNSSSSSTGCGYASRRTHCWTHAIPSRPMRQLAMDHVPHQAPVMGDSGLVGGNGVVAVLLVCSHPVN